jgi:hypothetical protein
MDARTGTRDWSDEPLVPAVPSTPGAGGPAPPPRLLTLLARLPLPVLHALSTLLYYVVFRLARLRVSLVERQIGRSLPELEPERRAALVDACLRRVADVAVEIVRGFAISPAELDGLEALRARLDGRQPVLLLTAHHCNWEWLLLALSAQLGHPLEALYKPLSSAPRGRVPLDAQPLRCAADARQAGRAGDRRAPRAGARDRDSGRSGAALEPEPAVDAVPRTGHRVLPRRRGHRARPATRSTSCRCAGSAAGATPPRSSRSRNPATAARRRA